MDVAETARTRRTWGGYLDRKKTERRQKITDDIYYPSIILVN
jgi:hypothetical protein